jgi:hypothetical protein
MFKMNKKVVGIFLIIFGSYLLIGNTLMSLLFNQAGPIGWAVPISPTDYWRNWWNNYGLVTIIIAIVGFIIIIPGIQILIKNNKRTMINAESN